MDVIIPYHQARDEVSLILEKAPGQWDPKVAATAVGRLTVSVGRILRSGTYDEIMMVMKDVIDLDNRAEELRGRMRDSGSDTLHTMTMALTMVAYGANSAEEELQGPNMRGGT